MSGFGYAAIKLESEDFYSQTNPDSINSTSIQMLRVILAKLRMAGYKVVTLNQLKQQLELKLIVTLKPISNSNFKRILWKVKLCTFP